MKKKYKVVMLPTSDKIVDGSLISRSIDNQLAIANRLTINDKNAEKDGHQNNYVYFISEEKIKVGDWYYYPNILGTKGVQQCESKEHLKELQVSKYSNCKKISATSDKSLTNCSVCGSDNTYHKMGCKTPSLRTNLAQIPQLFLEEYCKNPVKEVYLEVEDNGFEVDMQGAGGQETCWISKIELKLTPNNEVITSPVEEKTYSKKEVYNLLFQAWIHGKADKSKDYKIREEWIKENL